ncbi:hypothetical protein G5714_020123 [Onychostoma macrolepis]|uniref:Uncharacterized protein n=1 Tax=Onychostoma macrolepis TaxID=369639 RepID=A0A7J6BYD5_9TELE|nr:hypothetical protein G5714_020123 [Onychostoma macrolepis]
MEDVSVMEELMERSDGAAQRDVFSDTDFMIDEQSSHASGMEVMDRLMFLEHRVQMQDDEIQLLKINMTDEYREEEEMKDEEEEEEMKDEEEEEVQRKEYREEEEMKDEEEEEEMKDEEEEEVQRSTERKRR